MISVRSVIVSASKKKVEKKKEIIKTLLDNKRAQNLGIFERGYRMQASEIDQRLDVFPGQVDALTQEHCMALRREQPNPEEREAYQKFKGDKSQLTDLDQFLMKMMEIPWKDWNSMKMIEIQWKR